jgi:hypothetical protein
MAATNPESDRALVRWIGKPPKPATLLLDGETSVQVGISRTGVTEAMNIVRGHDPDVIEARDKEGTVLRRLQMRSPEESESKRKPIENTTIVELSRVMRDVQRDAADAVSRQSAQAFDELLKLCGLLARRMTMVEGSVMRMFREKEYLIAQQLAGGGDDDDGLDKLAGTVLGRALLGPSVPAAPQGGVPDVADMDPDLMKAVGEFAQKWKKKNAKTNGAPTDGKT